MRSASSVIRRPRAAFWTAAGWRPSNNVRDTLTFFTAHIMFGVVAITFGIVFWVSSHQHDTVTAPLEWVVFAGIGATFYASLATTYDFVTRQAPGTEQWFRGLSTVLLALSILLCLFAMALHDNTNYRYGHLYAVIAVLVLFVVWDFCARWYYMRRSIFWFDEYSRTLAIDVMLLVAFVLAVAFTLLKQDATAEHATTDREIIQSALLCILLFMELIFYAYFSFSQARELRNADQPMPVPDGYERVAEYYDKGNAIMTVERHHTQSRLGELCTADGVVLDLGCGTGRYVDDLARSSKLVIAVDRSDAMLRILRTKLRDPINVRVYQSDVVSLPDNIEPGSIDLIVCCLVIDHLDRFQLQAAVQQAARALRPNGRLYITDVNGYFQLIDKQHARFLDDKGRLRTIRVYPHTIPDVVKTLRKAGFEVEMRDVVVDTSLAQHHDLQSLAGFPLITEYVGTKVA